MKVTLRHVFLSTAVIAGMLALSTNAHLPFLPGIFRQALIPISIAVFSQLCLRFVPFGLWYRWIAGTLLCTSSFLIVNYLYQRGVFDNHAFHVYHEQYTVLTLLVVGATLFSICCGAAEGIHCILATQVNAPSKRDAEKVFKE